MKYQDFLVLLYLKNHMYLNDFKYADIFNEYPIFLGKSKDVSDALKVLSELEFLSFEWDKGKFSVNYNVNKFIEFFTPEKEQIIKIKRETKSPKEVKTEFNKKELDIINYYKELQTLPKIITMTPKRIFALKNALEHYNVSEIKDALLFASKQQWLINKTGEQWCDMSWILNKIYEFMPNGKYNKEVENKIPTFANKTSTVFL